MTFTETQFAGIAAAQGIFAPDAPVWVARAPGRLDVMGGNVDYTGGLVLQGLLQPAVWAAVQLRSDSTVRVRNPGAAAFGWDPEIVTSGAALNDVAAVREAWGKTASSRWVLYVLGCLHLLRQRHGEKASQGLEIFIASDLPPNKGVSSSAALEVAVLKAAAAACGISLTGIALATAAQWVENVVVGAACGIMDQAAIVLGSRGRLLPMLCQPCNPLPALTLPPDVALWGIDSAAPRSTTGAAYEAARAAAFIGYALICEHEGLEITPDPDPDPHSPLPRPTDTRWNGYLSNLRPAEFRSRHERLLPESISGREALERIGRHVDPFTTVRPEILYPVKGAVRYAVEENQRVAISHALLEASPAGLSDNSLSVLSEILRESHVAYADCGLGSSACDALVAMAHEAGLPGAKMTGGGAGGVVAVLGRLDDAPRVRRLAERYGTACGLNPSVFQGSSDGADAFGVRRLSPTGD